MAAELMEDDFYREMITYYKQDTAVLCITQ